MDVPAASFEPQVFQTIGLEPVALGEDGTPQYNKIAEQMLYNLPLGKTLLDIPVLWHATLFKDKTPMPESHVWLWKWLTSGAKRLAVIWPGDHGKTTEVSWRYVLWRLLRCPDYKILNIQKSIGQAHDVMIQIQATLVQPEFIQLYGIQKPKRFDNTHPCNLNKIRLKHAPPASEGEKTQSLHVYSIESKDILGNRADEVVDDDTVTPDNSNSPEKRDKHIMRESQVLDKTMSGSGTVECQHHCGGHDLYRKIGTPFYDDDALMRKRELADIYIGPNDWSTPENLTKADLAKWIVIHKDAEIGMKAGRTLWNFRYPLAHLHQMRDRDPGGYVGYLQRMRCQVRDHKTAKFHKEWFMGGINPADGNEYRGCFNPRRSLGELPALPAEQLITFQTVNATDPMDGTEKRNSSQFCNITLGMSINGKRRYLVDAYVGIIPQVNGKDYKGQYQDEKTQIGTMVARYLKYGCKLLVVECNGQQRTWVTQVNNVAPFIKEHQIIEHQTGTNKYDPNVGIPGMAGIFELGMFDIPYKDERSQRFAKQLVEQFHQWVEHGKTRDDIVMAVWMANLYLTKRQTFQILRPVNLTNLMHRPAPADITPDMAYNRIVSR